MVFDASTWKQGTNGVRKKTPGDWVVRGLLTGLTISGGACLCPMSMGM